MIGSAKQGKNKTAKEKAERKRQLGQQQK